jgi:hypothetical protein
MIEMSPKAIVLAACLLSCALVGCGILGFGSIAAAHHSGAAYDNEHPQTVEGTVKQVNWANPHITFVVETDATEGPQAGTQTATWVFEVSSPGVLTRSGWTKRSLQPGDHAVFLYAPLRDGKHGGYLHKVTLSNGQVLTYSLTPDGQ